ncbi:hypothetical protein PAMA_007119 [Pampus argenteus]
METFELWVSSEVPLVQGKKKGRRRRRRDLDRLVPQRRADRDLARQTAAEPEQQEANPNTDQQNRRNPAWAGQSVSQSVAPLRCACVRLHSSPKPRRATAAVNAGMTYWQQ